MITNRCRTGSTLPGFRGIHAALILLMAWLPAGAIGAAEGDPGRMLIYAGTALLDPERAPAKRVLITLQGERIASVAEGIDLATASRDLDDSDVLVDLSCCFVMPGLIDIQTHLTSEPGLPSHHIRLTEWTDADFTLRAMRNASATLYAGFTTIRDMGHHGDSVYAVRDAVERGDIPGPRMQVAGEVIRPTGGELRSWMKPEVENLLRSHAVCDGPYDCKRAVREAQAIGATTIKVETKQDLLPGSESQFDSGELIAIREAAHALGLKVTASAFSAPSMNQPLLAGFDGVVHGTFIDGDTLALLKQSGAFYIPTLLAARVVKEIADNPASPVSAEWRAENLAIYHGMTESFQAAYAHGVNIAFGTDAGWRPHGANAEQLRQMVELGMSPAEVLKTATVNAARAMGWEDRVGSLSPGLYGDLIAVAGNPLERIELLEAPLVVIKGGMLEVDRRSE